MFLAGDQGLIKASILLYRSVVEKASRLLDFKGSSVLDLCCGPGRHSLVLAERGLTVTGVDRTEFLLERARTEAATRGLEIE